MTTTTVTAPALRVIQPSDEARLERLFYRLSPESVYRRFFTLYTTPPCGVLRKLVDLDHDTRDAIVAVVGDEVVGVARYAAVGPGEAEVAVVIDDAWQGHGLGRRLLACVAALARLHGYPTLTATVLAENRPAIAMLRAVFPEGVFTPDGTEYGWRVALQPQGVSPDPRPSRAASRMADRKAEEERIAALCAQQVSGLGDMPSRETA